MGRDPRGCRAVDDRQVDRPAHRGSFHSLPEGQREKWGVGRWRGTRRSDCPPAAGILGENRTPKRLRAGVPGVARPNMPVRAIGAAHRGPSRIMPDGHGVKRGERGRGTKRGTDCPPAAGILGWEQDKPSTAQPGHGRVLGFFICSLSGARSARPQIKKPNHVVVELLRV